MNEKNIYIVEYRRRDGEVVATACNKNRSQALDTAYRRLARSGCNTLAAKCTVRKVSKAYVG